MRVRITGVGGVAAGGLAIAARAALAGAARARRVVSPADFLLAGAGAAGADAFFLAAGAGAALPAGAPFLALATLRKAGLTALFADAFAAPLVAALAAGALFAFGLPVLLAGAFTIALRVVTGLAAAAFLATFFLALLAGAALPALLRAALFGGALRFAGAGRFDLAGAAFFFAVGFLFAFATSATSGVKRARRAAGRAKSPPQRAGLVKPGRNSNHFPEPTQCCMRHRTGAAQHALNALQS